MCDYSIIDVISRINAENKLSHNTPDDFLVCIPNKDSESIWLTEPVTKATKKLVFNYKKNKCHSFIVKRHIIKEINIPESAKIKERSSDKSNVYINFDFLDEEIIKFIKEIVIYYIEHFEPSDKFGCCSKYKECSAAKKCLHDNVFYSKACWYRKNLESGNIFY